VERKLFSWFPSHKWCKTRCRFEPNFVLCYVDVLLTQHNEAGTGCFVHGWFVGAMVYACDLVLLAPTAMAIRRMLSFCILLPSSFVCHSMLVKLSV